MSWRFIAAIAVLFTIWAGVTIASPILGVALAATGAAIWAIITIVEEL